jgi:hypothetical protein
MRLCPFALAICTTLVLGCAPNHDAIDKDLSDLRAEVGRLRARQETLSERLETLEIARGELAKRGPDASVEALRAVPGDHPQLDVVHLSPSEGDGDADTEGGRPVVRAVGAEGATRSSKKVEKPIALRGGYFKKPAAATPPKVTGTSSDVHSTVNP